MIAPDVAITIDKSLEGYKESGEKEHLSKISGGKKIIAIHYDKQSAQDDEWQFLINKTIDFINENNYFALLLTDQKDTPVLTSQLKMHEEMKKSLNHAEVYKYDSVDGLLQTLKNCDSIITTKLHVAIVSVAMERATYALPCHPKTERFFNQIELTDVCLPMGHWTEESLTTLFEKEKNGIKPDAEVLQKVKNTSAKGLEHLKDFIQNN